MVNLSHQQTGDEETMEYVRNLKETGIELLCRFGRFGVGKSIIAGMFEFEIPKECRSCSADQWDREKWSETGGRADEPGNYDLL